MEQTTKPKRPSMISSDFSSASSFHEDVEESTEEQRSPEKKRDDSSPSLAHKENVAVNRSKLLVYAVLLLAAATAATGTYYFTHLGEQGDFEEKFNSNAQEMIRGSEDNSKVIFGKAIKISDSLTSFALATNATWPFVTLPDFEVATTPPFETSVGGDLIMFAPRVFKKDKKAFEEYAQLHQGWIQQDLQNRGLPGADPGKIPEKIYFVTKDDDVETEFSAPLWQIGPAPKNASIILKDLYSQASFRRMIDDVLIEKDLLLSEVVDQESLDKEVEGVDYFSRGDQPSSYAVLPVFDSYHKDKSIVGFLFTVVPWEIYFSNILSDAAKGILVEVEDTCGSVFSYLVNGPTSSFNGYGRISASPEFRELALSTDFAEFARFNGAAEMENLQFCNYKVTVYPSKEYKDEFITNQPFVIAAVVAVVFFFTSAVFALYDFMVSRRQKLVMDTATRTTAIVEQMFPKNVQDRILDGSETNRFSFGHKTKLKAFLHGENEENDHSKPIADLFPEVTILFCDIVGFTAWSSTREPCQVFTLLETIFSAFDKIAKKRSVFKVETVGDCYVAVCGLPDVNPRHAIVMARFASDCCCKFNRLVQQLELSLGPDTGDLAMRFGLHSGPVTAGVLRGERARFQLFGDTMNTASRMESTGKAGMIQISQSTCDILRRSGKEHWLTKRKEKVQVKGKGKLTTYFLQVQGKTPTVQSVDSSVLSSTGNDDENSVSKAPRIKDEEMAYEKIKRLVHWNADILVTMLREIAATRRVRGLVSDTVADIREAESSLERLTTFEEVAESISLPTFDPTVAAQAPDPSSIIMDNAVVEEATNYVTAIASLYRKNAFHNMEHASHVSMSVVKLFSRIVAPEQQQADSHATLHDHTYGITSDPLTRFAVFFAALVHDIDHQGVPNTQLVKEKTAIADVYDNKSVAERNSIDLSWSLLMQDDYKNFRRAIYDSVEEFKRFRQLVVNVVLATDIMDKDLKTVRNERWEKAFSEKAESNEKNEGKKAVDRKATIVLEHLIQASDVAHVMQHWHIYIKWNERLFKEMANAYKHGRAEKHPVDFWYKGEIGFFDFYVIPLAKKLRNCGVFGVSSDECLSYAEANRHEWERKGQQIVAEYMEKLGTVDKLPTTEDLRRQPSCIAGELSSTTIVRPSV